MQLDLGTLAAAGGLVGFVSGLLLILAWTQYDCGRSALRLGVSHLCAAGAIMMLALSSDQYPLMPILAQPLFVLAGFLALSAALSFDGAESLEILLAMLALSLSIIAYLFFMDYPAQNIRASQLAIVGLLFLCAAIFLWRRKIEKSTTRHLLATIFFMHSIVQVIGLSEALDRNMLVYGVPSFSSWYGIIHIESMLYFIGSTLFLVTMLKERSEIRHEIASLTDPLTGLPNRRAFFHHGHRVLERCRRSKAPCTFLVLDLDRFKAINDTHGHAMGDRVLQVFAAVIPQQLRSSDIIGRLGGEEFAVILPRTHLREAAEIGEQLRAAFREAALMVDGIEIRATLSGGIAVAFGEAQTVADVLERADAALYRAKLNGRDRIESDAGPRNIHIVKKVS